MYFIIQIVTVGERATREVQPAHSTLPRPRTILYHSLYNLKSAVMLMPYHLPVAMQGCVHANTLLLLTHAYCYTSTDNVYTSCPLEIVYRIMLAISQNNDTSLFSLLASQLACDFSSRPTVGPLSRW